MVRHSRSQSWWSLGCAAALICVILMGAADVAVTQTNVPGNQGSELSRSWIGGYREGKKFVSIFVDAKPDGSRAYLLLENSREVPIAGWRLEKNRLSFSIKPGSATLSFDGMVSNGIARGTVRRGDTQAPFHLVNFRDLSTEALDRFAGSYAFDNRLHLLVQRIGVALKYIAPMLAAGSPDVAFIVLVGPSGLTAALQESYDDEISLRRAGFSEAIIKRASELQGAINNYYRTGEQREKVQQAINAARAEPWFAATDLGTGLAALEQLPSRETLGEYWWRKIMDYDPTEHWRLVRAPTLVLLGECDDSAPAGEGARRIGDALEKGGNRDYTIKLLPMANHGLWIVRECFVTDYSQVPGYEAQYLPVMFTWLRHRGFSGPRKQ